MLDYDTYLDIQTDKYYQEQEDSMPVSNCCGAYIEDDDINDICPECKEHSLVISAGEYNTEKHESAMCDKADSDRELKGDRDE